MGSKACRIQAACSMESPRYVYRHRPTFLFYSKDKDNHAFIMLHQPIIVGDLRVKIDTKSLKAEFHI